MAPRSLGPESWDDLFDFLDPDRRGASGPDRDRTAETRLSQIVRKLVSFFAGRQCADADDLAMETVLRVAARCRDVDVSGFPDRAGYFYGVARNLFHESLRSASRESTALQSLRHELLARPPDPGAWEEQEAVERCLDRCLATLPRRTQRLIVRYHGTVGAAKAASHRSLADEFGKSVNALRIEVHRTRKALHECVVACLGPADRGDAAGGLSPGL
jgi:RNA polymerase sigma factor (sigma-70 family)